MFTKLARVAVICASFVLAISRIFFAVHIPTRLADSLIHPDATQSGYVYSQLPARQP